jgi:DNA-directed RNA polymerase subunit RPC12/RpoP
MDLKYKIGFGITAIASICLFIVSVYDMLSLQDRFRYWFFASIVLVCISLLIFLYMYRSSRKEMDPVVLFKKTLQGGLYHYKCPICNGIFALKESRKNDGCNLTLNCPGCGTLGRISSQSPKMVEKIPTEKSPRVSFICTICGERLNIWAEGKPLIDNITIFSCPYCGSKKQMKLK